jgi:hypothetical protein
LHPNNIIKQKTSGNKPGKDLLPLAKNEGREDSNK